jgi:nucleotide-binding universal stress UspA family protein
MRLWPDAQSRLVCFGKPGPSRQLLDEAAEYCASHGFQVASGVVDGHADQALLPYARQADADLIVAGDGFRHSAIRDVLGDTMSRLIKDTDRSLFVSH